jgi:hypothetical protein
MLNMLTMAYRKQTARTDQIQKLAKVPLQKKGKNTLMAKTPLTAWQKAVANPPYKTQSSQAEPEALIVEMKLMRFQVGDEVVVNSLGPADWQKYTGTIVRLSSGRYDWVVETDDNGTEASFYEYELDPRLRV